MQIAGTKIRLYGIDAPETKQSCRNAQGKDYACGAIFVYPLLQMRSWPQCLTTFCRYYQSLWGSLTFSGHTDICCITINLIVLRQGFKLSASVVISCASGTVAYAGMLSAAFNPAGP